MVMPVLVTVIMVMTVVVPVFPVRMIVFVAHSTILCWDSPDLSNSPETG
jgi:hypothetical protein